MPTEEDRQTLFNAYRSAGLPSGGARTPPWRFDRDAAESIRSSNTKLSNNADYDPFLSPFQPYHKLELHYPALDLLATDGSEACNLHTPSNAKERYQPLPLIMDEKVWKNAGREKGPEAMFYTLWKANPAIAGVSRRGIQCDDLVVDIKEVVKYVGKTTLKVVLFKNPSKWGPWVRVRRDTYLRLKNDDREVERQEFEMSLDDFLRRKGVEARWYLDLIDLIAIRTERAARHVQLMLYAWSRDKKQGIKLGAPAIWERFCNSWKPQRHPDYASYLDGVAKEVKTMSAVMLVGRPCKVCNKPFKSPLHAPYTMLCCQKIIGKSCLLAHLERTNAHTFLPPFKPPTCPHCDAQIFKHESLLALNANLDTSSNQYIPNPLHTPWENFERSCSDLDIHNPSASSYKLTINPELFIQAFQYILTSSIREPEEEPHYQLHKMPEFLLLQEILFYHIRHLSGLETTLSHLHNFLIEQVRLEFRRRFYEAGLEQFLPPGMQRRSWVGEEEIKRRVWVRDGVEEFSGRVLRRTLGLIELRGCGCGKNEGKLFHEHAVRMYYDMGVAMKSEHVKNILEWQGTKEGRSYVRGFVGFRM